MAPNPQQQADPDVLALGCVAVDHLLYVTSYPAANTKVAVCQTGRQCGGMAATALVAAARLGSRCAFAGTLGPDEGSRFVTDCLRREGIDLTHVVLRDNARPIHSTVVVDQGNETGRRAVVVTCGADGCWYLEEAGASPRHQPAYPVRVADTTGCGDVFHGAYASALVRGAGLAERVRFAAAAAALKATRPGGQEGIPTRAEVEAFLAMQVPEADPV
jgi:sugar/nucleoside kinase (ribokinase family)